MRRRRYCLATIDYYTKDLQNTNMLYKMALKCASCAMWCLQKTIEFISYFGFVYIAMEGGSFCSACKKTFAFLLTPKNAAQTAVNKTVEKLLVVIIAWSTPTVLALCCYGCLENSCMGDYDDDNNPLYPAILTWVAAFFLSDSIVMPRAHVSNLSTSRSEPAQPSPPPPSTPPLPSTCSLPPHMDDMDIDMPRQALVFECTIDTIFLCSFKDAAEYGGKYMSADMRDAFGLDVAEQEAKPVLTAKDFKDKHPSKGAPPADSGGTEMGGPTIRA